MENFKEDQVYFPMILETSDFLWFEVPAIQKSQSSYEPYLISEMSYNEGLQDYIQFYQEHCSIVIAATCVQ